MASIRFFRQLFLDLFRSVPEANHHPSPATWSDSEITGACLGHSTVLVDFLGAWLLTDPVFSTRVGPGIGSWVIGPKRYLRPALAQRDLPKIDLLILSHAHFDHLDLPSLRRLPRDTVVVTAAKTGDLLRHFHTVHELPWGKSIELTTRAGVVRMTAFEVQHWGARMMKDDFRGYNGYVIEKDGRALCYGGDTAKTGSFSAVRKIAPRVDLILMPIAAYNPWIRSHCNPEEAVAMAEAAGAQYFVPVHQETFKLSSEPMTEPSERIQRAFQSRPERLLAQHVGETFRVPLGDGIPVKTPEN